MYLYGIILNLHCSSNYKVINNIVNWAFAWCLRTISMKCGQLFYLQCLKDKIDVNATRYRNAKDIDVYR